METFIPLITGFIGALIGALGSISTVWIQANIADRRAMYRQAAELALEEWKEHLARADKAAKEGAKQSVLPPIVYYQTYAGVMKVFDEKGTVTPEDLRKIYDVADGLMEAVTERQAKRQLEGAKARAKEKK